MIAQDHIDAIRRALIKSEEAIKATRKALRLVEEHHAIQHARLDKAQKAYVATRDGKNVVGVLTGGGAVVCLVFDNGVAWVSG